MIFKCSVNIDPIYLDKNIKHQILKTIKETYEKKCLEAGYINKINKISKISEGTIYDCDLSGNISFNLDVDANIINYNIGDNVVCKISEINENLGAIICKKIKHVDERKFHNHDVFILIIILTDNAEIENLNIGDNVNVEIYEKKVVILDNQIHLFGRLV